MSDFDLKIKELETNFTRLENSLLKQSREQNKTIQELNNILSEEKTKIKKHEFLIWCAGIILALLAFFGWNINTTFKNIDKIKKTLIPQMEQVLEDFNVKAKDIADEKIDKIQKEKIQTDKSLKDQDKKILGMEEDIKIMRGQIINSNISILENKITVNKVFIKDFEKIEKLKGSLKIELSFVEEAERIERQKQCDFIKYQEEQTKNYDTSTKFYDTDVATKVPTRLEMMDRYLFSCDPQSNSKFLSDIYKDRSFNERQREKIRKLSNVEEKAIINGEPFLIGESVNGAKVKSMNEKGVMFEHMHTEFLIETMDYEIIS